MTYAARKLIGIGASLCLGLMLSAPVAGAQTAGKQAPVSVGVMAMKRQPVPQGFDLPGRAVAYEQVAVRPRVGGVVTKILYTPGTPVSAGTPLFQLDDAAYVAAVASDAATLATAEANVPVKQAAFDRATRLVNQGATRVDVETAQYELAAAKAELDAARAALDYARTQLSWTTITSPIEGIPEVQSVSVGDLVTAGQATAMTTVTRLDPIYVDMLEPSMRFLDIRRRIDDGILTPNQRAEATLYLENGEVYTGSGQLVTPSAVVSTSTGTITVRFAFENPDHRIMPGMFLRGFVTLGTMQGFLVPQRATARSSTGELTAFIVDNEDKARQVTLTSTGTYRNNWIVTAGLQEGDRVILDALKSVTAGRAVIPVEAHVDEFGLVQNGAPAPDDSAPATGVN
ncbi:efflux RND transporter periplasmic adaptor subunit [Paenirhodobacter populi]|uniref:Efflux RND transporter periplasmic adaptor subunit n=1 Tax=Paenirhodobacter populi TaxID=2306993 RepID=A0A451GC14_9RHOB|nr:efflux RND transporter periplasmic adaptor subunit [Sinirhodobacter populi]RWR12687.1 efflux RND transporter periplasmic adaptor subunit [Sinirhodobacter populi]